MLSIAVLISSLWLGILTSISPCPLATNILAMSFISKKLENSWRTLIQGIFYSVGRMLCYVLLSILTVYSLISIPFLSNFLQTYMNKIIGPVLILAGMFLLELLTLSIKGSNIGLNISSKLDTSKSWSAVLMGFVFALSFCPVSAALFFGSMIPLSVKYKSGIILPSLYGLGTALPVLVVSIFLATGFRKMGKVFKQLSQFELWARRITGIAFIFVGIYFVLSEIFHIL